MKRICKAEPEHKKLYLISGNLDDQLFNYFCHICDRKCCSGLLLRVIHKYRQCMKWNGLVNVWKANADEIKIKYLHRMIV